MELFANRSRDWLTQPRTELESASFSDRDVLIHRVYFVDEVYRSHTVILLSRKSTVFIVNYTQCNHMRVESNDDMKAPICEGCTIREMTRAGRNGIGATAVCRAFNIPDVYVHIFVLPHSISGNLDQITGASRCLCWNHSRTGIHVMLCSACRMILLVYMKVCTCGVEHRPRKWWVQEAPKALSQTETEVR